MQDTLSYRLIDHAKVPSCAKEFLLYCDMEYERRANSGDAFDEALFRNAVDLALRKLCNTPDRSAL